jgi:hypothetical protein
MSALSYSEEIVWRNEHDRAGIPFIECPHHMMIAQRFVPTLDREAVVDAMRALVACHTPLRSTYAGANRFVHEAPNTASLPVSYLEVEKSPGSLDKGELDRAIAQHANAPFALAGQLPFRMLIATVNGRETILCITVHHIAFDSWSRRVLVRQFGELYAHSVSGVRAELPAATTDYADYVRLQRDGVMRGGLERQADYWRRRLEGVPELSLGCPDQRIQDSTAGRHNFALSPETAGPLRSVARSCSTTMAVVLTSVFAILLHGLSGLRDIVIGVPIADRPRRELENLIGLFMSVLPIRCTLSAEMSCLEVVRGVRAAFLEAYQNRELPYGYLIEMLGCREERHVWPFQAVLNYVSRTTQPLSIPGTDMSPIAVDVATPAAARVSLHLNDSGGALSCAILYDTRFLRPGGIARLTEQFCRVAQHVGQQPHTRVEVCAAGRSHKGLERPRRRDRPDFR